MKNVYLIDPYYADSHRYWAEQIADNLKANTRIFSESPVHWKWKMEGAAINLAEEINQIDLVPDAFLVTDYLNLALFKSLLHSRFLAARFVVYMHENQLTYPFSEYDTDKVKNRDSHYGFINYTSCLVADAAVFNSQYHLNVFYKSVRLLSNNLPDTLPIERLLNKSSVIHSIISTDGFNLKEKTNNNPKNIIWNHRWDYDKKPKVFLNAIVELQSREQNFNLILLGRMSDKTKVKFAVQLLKLKDRITHMGFANSREDYIRLLEKGDIIISTSIHDFLGLSVAEGIYAGCRPVLPNDLAYPELVDPALHNEVFYERNKLIEYLINALNTNWPIENQIKQRKHIEDNLTWKAIEHQYEQVLFNS